MTLEFWYWILLAIWVIFGAWPYFKPEGRPKIVAAGPSVLLFLLLLILGWAQFGPPIHG